MAEIELEQLPLQRFAIRQVAVVAERDAERRIDVEGLRFKVGEGGARGRITAMADAGIAVQLAHVSRAKHITDVARALPHVEHLALGRGDAGSVLAAMLQQQQRVVEELIDRRMRNAADDSAHVC